MGFAAWCAREILYDEAEMERNTGGSKHKVGVVLYKMTQDRSKELKLGIGVWWASFCHICEMFL